MYSDTQRTYAAEARQYAPEQRHERPDDQRRHDRADADAPQPPEKQQRQRGCDDDERHVEYELHAAEVFARRLCEHAHDPLAGHGDDVRRDLDADAAGENGAAEQHAPAAREPPGRVQPAQRGHTHVEEGAEEHVRRDLQQLHGREIPPLDGDLDQDKHCVHKEGEAAEAQREAQTEHVRQARDLRRAEAALRDEGDAERVDEQTEREKEVAQGDFPGVFAAWRGGHGHSSFSKIR